METVKNVFVFSGQGSQYYKMGQTLYDQDPIFKSVMDETNCVIKRLTRVSVIEQLYQGTKRVSDPLDDLRLSSSALLMVEYSMAQALIRRGLTPDALVGASLGELLCAVISEVLPLEELIECFVEYILTLEERQSPGGMIAILADPDEFALTPVLFENSYIAAVNGQAYYVVSCAHEKSETLVNYLKSRDIAHQVLPVKVPFHSPLIEHSKGRFQQIAAKLTFAKPKIPIYSCVTGEPIETFDKEHYWRILRAPIYFQKAIRSLEALGTHHYFDLSPSAGLEYLIRRDLAPTSRSRCFATLTPMGDVLKNMENLQQYCLPGLGAKPVPSRQNAVDPLTIDPRTKNSPTTRNQTMRAFVFPGQGSQTVGMGAELFERYPDLTGTASDILGYSIRELCLEDPRSQLAQTEYTQPAIFVVNALTYYRRLDEGGKEPDYVLGHSLGEFNALLAAGVFDFATGLRLVQGRAAFMGKMRSGGMAAVLGLSEEDLRGFLLERGFPEIDIANLNTPSQIVVSGPRESIEKFCSAMVASRVRCVPLNVGGAFHSRLMAQAGSQFREFLDRFEFKDPRIVTISNYTARPYAQGSVKENLSMQLVSSVKWSESVRYLMGKNVNTFEEMGHGTILTDLVTQIRQKAAPLIVNDAGPVVAQPTRAHPVVAEKTNAPQKNGAPSFSKQSAVSRLGCEEFKQDYRADYAYIVGPMHSGISSVEMVERCSRAGILCFFGADRVSPAKTREAVDYLKAKTKGGARFGVGVSFERFDGAEHQRIDQLLEAGVAVVSVSGCIRVTAALVKYRLQGLTAGTDGNTRRANHILLKTFRPEVAREFMRPAPAELVEELLSAGAVTREQARLARTVSVADDICVEVNCGGITSLGSAEIVTPLLSQDRDAIRREYRLHHRVRIGLAGGIGTPYAVASAFINGVDFVMTGSINQCTAESGQSDLVKSMLARMDIHDTDYIPTDDLLSSKTKVQTLKKGVFFPAKAARLHEIFRTQEGLSNMPVRLKEEVEKKYLKKSFAEVLGEIVEHGAPAGRDSLEKSPTRELQLILRWYYNRAIDLALGGSQADAVDFNVHTSGAMGACNQWLRDTPYAAWRSRHAEEIGARLMQEAEQIVQGTLGKLKLRYSAQANVPAGV